MLSFRIQHERQLLGGWEKCLAVSPQGEFCTNDALYRGNGLCWEHLSTLVEGEPERYINDLLSELEINNEIIGACLQGIDLSDKDLSGRWFRDCDLRRAKFKRTKAIGGRFEGCWLDETNWMSANLTRAELSNCWFTYANFSRANMHETKFRKSDFSQAELASAEWTDGRADNCIFNDCKMIRLIITHTWFIKCELLFANLEEVKGDYAVFDDAILHKAVLIGAELRHASFRRADLTDAKMQGAICPNANFTQANMGGTDLYLADLTNAKFRYKELAVAHVNEAIVTEVNLSHAGLSYADVVKDMGRTIAIRTFADKLNPRVWTWLNYYTKYRSIYRIAELGVERGFEYTIGIVAGGATAVMLHEFGIGSPVVGFWVTFGAFLGFCFFVPKVILPRRNTIIRMKEMLFEKEYRGAEADSWLQVKTQMRGPRRGIAIKPRSTQSR